MAPKRRYVRRTAPAPPREVPEPAVPPVAPVPAGPTEVQELRAQVAALTGRFDRLQELLEQQAVAAAAATGPGRGPPAPSVRAPDAAEGVGGVSVPVAAQPPPVDIPPASSSSPTPAVAAEEAERERGYVALTRFTKFHPPTFDGEVVDPAAMEPPGDLSLFGVCNDFAAMGLSHGGRFARERRGGARQGRNSIDSALSQRPEIAVPRVGIAYG
uniref:Uncharacterized protein n=1 Tax=Ananas comosus var. bracteatus TaxID=296719 RepID=A0A6V7PW75_ANACO|nr:unnamed protein product [Ananas comosus var. bracteatus]